MKNTIYKITGMHCASCASIIQMDLEDAGIESKVSFAKNEAMIKGDYDFNKIKEIVNKAGYDIMTK